MKAPKGLKEIIAAYGNPSKNGKLDSVWLKEQTILMELPYPMRLAWDLKTVVTRCRVHKKVAPVLCETFKQVWNAARLTVKKRDGFDKTTAYYDAATLKYLREFGLDLFGGVFAFRVMRNSSRLSVHSWAIAIDIDPKHNALGTAGRMPRWVVRIFEDIGFIWGGRWKGSGCDPMHFQLCSGY
ncbi:MAG TPA: M15 family metallopeptidase [Armatimonadota bacterium]|nr:M15 family metallopeptidase [Armatimonadota bacterium]